MARPPGPARPCTAPLAHDLSDRSGQNEDEDEDEAMRGRPRPHPHPHPSVIRHAGNILRPPRCFGLVWLQGFF